MKQKKTVYRSLMALVTVAILTGFSSSAYAWGYIGSAFDAKYPDAANLTALTASCTLCHAGPSGKPFNAYGSALKQTAGKMDFAAIENVDSDGDGFDNIVEINAAGGGTHPGDSSDKPADTTAPVITLIGDDPVILNAGDVYNDAGASAEDDIDGDISADIVTVSNVDTSTGGDYTVSYNVSDAAGNPAAEVTRTVTVIPDTPDTTAPTIDMQGVSPISVLVDGIYNDAGATANDDRDGDISANVVMGGDSVDTSTTGTYVITYNVSDAAGNPAAEQTRTVIVGDTESDADGDGVSDGIEGADAAQSSAASGLMTTGGSMVTITSAGEALSGVNTSASSDAAPADVDANLGVIGYTTSVSAVDGVQKVKVMFSTALPSNVMLYSVDASDNYTEMTNFTVVDNYTVEITCTDGGMNDLDGVADGFIQAAVAFAQGKSPASPGGGCLLPSVGNIWMIPLALFMLTGISLVRRHV